MEHTYFFDGDARKISWVIETNDVSLKQMRVHAENYYDKVSAEQSKYIALHVGIFWGIGRFVIKNGDSITIMVDRDSMFEHLSNNKTSGDPFIESRTGFIKQLINQRNLDIRYKLIRPDENKAAILLYS